MQKRRLGISLYPERSTFEQDVAYLEKAAKLGFDLLFIALLGAGDRQHRSVKKAAFSHGPTSRRRGA